MKPNIIIPLVVGALALPISAMAQTPQEPGKTGDGVKNPPATEPGRPAEPLRTPNAAERNEPGKASDAVKEPSSAKPTAEMQRKFKGPITAVDREAKTITINDQSMGSHKLHLGDSTKLNRDGKQASWDDLKVGATVEGTCRGGTDKAHAETLNIGN